jgi:hypothetical protein
MFCVPTATLVPVGDRTQSVAVLPSESVIRPMSDTEDAVAEFLDEADTVFGEYDQGYMNADVALERLENHIDALREQVK